MLQEINTEVSNILQNSNTDIKVNSLNQLAYKYRYSNPVKSIEISDLAYSISSLSKDDIGKNFARGNSAFAHFILSHDFPVLKELSEACMYFSQHIVIPEYPIVLNYIGNFFDSIGEYEEGLTNCHKALKYAIEFGLRELEGDTLSTIGLIMSRIPEISGAIDCFKKSLDIRVELDNKPAIASSLNLLARTYALDNQFELSEQNYINAIALRISINEIGALPWSYLGIASLFEMKKDFANAQLYFLKGLEYTLKNDDKRCTLHCNFGLGRIYLVQNNLAPAKEYLDKTVAIANALNAKPLLYEAYEIMSGYFERIGNIDEAYTYFKKFHQIKESVLNDQTHSKLKNQQLMFEMEKIQKDNEIHQLRNIELKNAYESLEKRTLEIIDSIDYAKNIQQAMLPPNEYFKNIFPDSFIYYNPKAIVSGDFYWCFADGDRAYFAAADCTGHGVPGGFMSILGISILNEIVNAGKILAVDQLLHELRFKVIQSLRQSIGGTSIKDGMDIALCCIDFKTNMLTFSGAFNPIYIVVNEDLIEIKGDRMPIGIFDTKLLPFTKHEIKIVPGMKVYLFSDGFIDQFGGADGKKLKAKRFKEVIQKVANEPIDMQRSLLDTELYNWFKGYEQVDDILVIGVKF